MIGEVFPAASEEAAASIVEEGPSKNGLPEVALVGEVTSVELDALQAAIGGESFVQVANSRGGGIIASSADVGPWISRIRPALTSGLSSVDDSRIDVVSEEWAAYEEMEGFEPEQLANILRQLVPVAKLAMAQGERLYLWNQL